MLFLPLHFDANEWFIILNTVFGFTWVFFFPKRYPTVISVLVVLLADCIALIIDHAIAGPPLDLYDINDTKKYEWFDVVTYLMYTPYALLYIYLYDTFRPKGLYLTAYIVGWSLLSVGFEWIAVILHVFTYNNWILLYSFGVYLVCSSLHILFFRFVRSYFNKTSGPHAKNAGTP